MSISIGRAIIGLAPVVLLLAGCTPSNSHLASLEARYRESQSDYATICERFRDDELDKFAVAAYSRPMINEYYMSGEQWFDVHNEPVSFAEVLQSTGISEERFQYYTRTLERLGAQCIRKSGQETEFLVESFGHLDDGYFVYILNSAGMPSAKRVNSVNDIPVQDEGDWCVQLRDDWYLVYGHGF